MPAVSPLKDILPANYGYVVLVGTGGAALHLCLAYNVMKARKQYKVEYPAVYSADNQTFNCIQRAHQNYLENASFFYFGLLVGGLELPRVTAAAGALYLVGRYAYAKGYSTGDPEKRKWGSWAHLPFFVLLANAICFASVHLNCKWSAFKSDRDSVM